MQERSILGSLGALIKALTLAANAGDAAHDDQTLSGLSRFSGIVGAGYSKRVGAGACAIDDLATALEPL